MLCRKPLAEPTVAANVLLWRTGALNIDGSRVGSEPPWLTAATPRVGTFNASFASDYKGKSVQGRWPPNLLLSHSVLCTADACDVSCAIRAMDAQSGVRHSAGDYKGNVTPPRNSQFHTGDESPGWGYSDTGGASRFFPNFAPDPDYDAPFLYTAKASRSERNAGCEGMPLTTPEQMTGRKSGSAGLVMEGGKANPYAGPTGAARVNSHPTVKPIALMSWLVRLITPPGGLVLDPFAGSGSTGVTCAHLGFDFIGIERESEYVAIAQARIAHAQGVQIPTPPTRVAAKQPPRKQKNYKTPSPFAQIALFD